MNSGLLRNYFHAAAITYKYAYPAMAVTVIRVVAGRNSAGTQNLNFEETKIYLTGRSRSCRAVENYPAPPRLPARHQQQAISQPVNSRALRFRVPVLA